MTLLSWTEKNTRAAFSGDAANRHGIRTEAQLRKLAISDLLLAQFNDVVIEKIGLDFRKEPRHEQERRVRRCAHAVGFEDEGSFVGWLVSSPLTQDQIEKLAMHLTVDEGSYFFRDQRSLSLLHHHILPELIQSRRGGDQRLGIWSAGCCTGEEPYSLAILLDQLIPDKQKWSITIFGTDINAQSLQKAREGIYDERSLSGVPSSIRNQYFNRKETGIFEILPRIKKMVKFSFLNLLEWQSSLPLHDTNEMDLICCCRVLRYFAPHDVHQVTERLCRSLVKGGWLAISPGEVSCALFSHCVAVNFPGVYLYQKEKHRTRTRVSFTPGSRH